MIFFWRRKRRDEKGEGSSSSEGIAVGAAPSRRELRAFKVIYPVVEPYAYVAIAEEPGTKRLMYTVIEPTLFEEEKRVLERLSEILLEELEVDASSLSRERAEEVLLENAKRIVRKYRIRIGEETFNKIAYYLVRDFVGYGKIDVMMKDHLVEDISCDGPNLPVYVWHREYESLPSNVMFNEDELDSFIFKLAYRCGKHISVAQPIMDGTLPDGSRVNATYGREISRRGSTFTIRRFRADPLTIVDLIMFNTISLDMAAMLWLAVEQKSSILVAGGVASGKTTLLNCISMFIRPELKIVTIEETAELQLPHENWIPLVARAGFGARGTEITLFDLLKAAMRQRPDYVIVGEVRGAEAYTLFQALATGHGVQCTIHAESPQAVINRLTSAPMNIPRPLIGLVDVITVQLRTRIGDRPVRRTSILTEVKGYNADRDLIELQDTFRWDPRTDEHRQLAESITLQKVMRKTGMTKEEVDMELYRRKIVLQWLIKKGIRRYREVGLVIREYYTSPESVYKRAKVELG
ncbi:MAG TPA: type IV secretory pathway protein [Candidatus Methanomethylia archaeon]|nr:type IV secretory pathway protein [Candidatus Methanomethylicia archaeon]